MLEFVLFLYYIDNLIDDLECPVLLFSNNAMIDKKIGSPADTEALIKDIKRI